MNVYLLLHWKKVLNAKKRRFSFQVNCKVGFELQDVDSKKIFKPQSLISKPGYVVAFIAIQYPSARTFELIKVLEV